MKAVMLAVSACVVLPVIVVILVVLAPPHGPDACTPVPDAVAVSADEGHKVRPMKADTYTLTSGFGPRAGTFHYGSDWAAEPGTPIYAASAGVVAQAGPASGFGTWVVLDHNLPDGVSSTVYGHMFADDVLVTTGQTVHAGQQIARVGYNGQTVPAGPGGAHLHFETWTGGTRLAGGTATDPNQWLTGASEPSTPFTTPRLPTVAPDVAATDPAPFTRSAPETDPGLPPLPPNKGSEKGLQVNAVRVLRELAAHYPQVTRFETWRPAAPGDPIADHPDGRAIDVMIPDYLSGRGKALGDDIRNYVMDRGTELAIDYTIWRGVYRDTTHTNQQMPETGDPTLDHYDHVHISVTADDHTSDHAAPAAPTGCEAAISESGHDDLAPGAVPDEYEQWYRHAGTLCPQITASLLAAQGKQESGFNPNAESSAGAQGIAQFLPGTAAAMNPDDGRPYVIDADGNGTASVWEPADAITGQGRYMCALARKIDSWIAEGAVTTHNPLELYLAAYNAGEGAVLRSGGFPTGHSDYQVQTRPYVDTILAQARHYSTTLS
ncbi:peptidase M23 [Nocardia sp. FDAARGOS_372]|nr:peptidase M23 [Nocardia sp. FDAARGOS_372]